MAFYYSREGRQFGPYTEEQLLGMITQGQLRSDELVWGDGMPQWSPAYAVFRTVPPPPPPAAAVAVAAPPAPAGAYAAPAYPAESPKERVAYILLGLFLGALGVHNFYAGYTGRAVSQLLVTLLVGWMIFPLVAMWIWNLVEVITVKQDRRGVPFV